MAILSARVRVPFLVLALVLAASAPARSQAAYRPRGPSPFRVLSYAVGGAVVGSWTGYVASQVTWSDWSDADGRSAHRIRFSVGGAALGLVVGVVMGSRRAGVAPAVPLALPRLAPPLPGRPITEEDIRRSSARSVTELIRRLRPQWLRSRGRDVLQLDSLHLGRDPLAAQGVRVYLNGSLFGGLDALDQVAVGALTGVAFLESTAAVLRYGTGNEDGAILLTTRPEP
jgi:hypothetical protein